MGDRRSPQIPLSSCGLYDSEVLMRQDFTCSPLVSRSFSAIANLTSPFPKANVAVVSLLVGLWCVVSLPAVSAQEQTLANTFLIPADRSSLRAALRAEEFISQGKLTEGVKVFQDLLRQPEDFFLNNQAGISWRKLVESQIGQFDPELRNIYEFEYNHEAQRLLDEFRQTHNLAALVECGSYYFFTPAGWQASQLFTRQLLDRGDYLSALIHIQRLLDDQRLTDQEYRYWQTQKALCHEFLQFDTTMRTTDIEGTRIDPQLDPDFVRMLSQVSEDRLVAADDWKMVGAQTNRNGFSSPLVPIELMPWAQSAFRSNDFGSATNRNTVFDLAQKLNTDSTNYWLPSLYPLVVDGKIIFRGVGTIHALDLKTGAPAWNTRLTDIEFDYLINNIGLTASVAPGQYPPLDLFLQQRLWRNLTTGMLSSDGERIYAIHDVGIPGAVPTSAGIEDRPHPMAPSDSTLLRAYDVDGGRWLWEVGGSRTYAPRETAATYFLGPPLAVDETLYILGEQNQEIRLLAFDAPTGELLWMQPLVMTDPSAHKHPSRSMQGLMPTYSRGLLICPTGLGTVMAIDPARRTLEWVFQLEEKEEFVPIGNRHDYQRKIQIADRLARDSTLSYSSWQNYAILAEGKYVVVPMLNDMQESLVCIRSTDGELLWKRPRENDLYVCGIYNSGVVTVSDHQIQSYRLDDGAPMWSQSIPIDFPSGAPIRAGRYLYVPTSTRRILTVDLANGRLLATANLSRDLDQPLGNLAAVDGYLVSLSAWEVRAFKNIENIERDIETRMAANPHDVEALIKLGELNLHRDREAEGLKYLRQALKHGDSPKAKELLAETLLEGLRLDFDKYEQLAGELSDLVQGSELAIAFVRHYAQGLKESGRVQQAFAQYLKFYDQLKQQPLNQVSDGMLRISGDYRVRTDRWICAQLNQLHHEADPDRKPELNKEIQQRLNRAVMAADPQQLRTYLRYFSGLPNEATARWELTRKLDPAADPLELERHYIWLLDHAQENLQPQVLHQYAKLLLTHERYDDAQVLIDRLAIDWKETVADVETGAQGEQVVADLIAAFPALANRQTLNKVWQGEELAALYEVVSKSSGQIRYSIPHAEQTGPFDFNTEYAIGSRRESISLINQQGNEFQTVTLPVRPMLNNLQSNYALNRGHFSLVVLGSHIVGLQSLFNEDVGRPLWMQPLRPETPLNQRRGIRVIYKNINGLRHPVFAVHLDTIGSVASIQDGYFCLQSLGQLSALDPFTGELLWTRGNNGDDGIVIAGSDYIYTENGDRLFSAIDGSQAKTMTLDTTDRILWRSGANVLAEHSTEDEIEFRLFDILNPDQIAWSISVPLQTKAISLEGSGNLLLIHENQRVDLIEPKSGRYLLRDIPLALVDVQVEPEVPAPEPDDPQEQDTADPAPVESPAREVAPLRAFLDKDCLYILQSLPKDPTVWFGQISANSIEVNGYVHAYDLKTGELRWTRKVEHQTYLVNQPQSGPVLTFAATVNSKDPNSNRNLYRREILLLDKRTGEIIFNDETSSRSENVIGFNTSAEEGTFEVLLSRSALTVRTKQETEQLQDARRSAIEQRLDQGEALFASMGCAKCHSTDGTEKIGPTLAGMFGQLRVYKTENTTTRVTLDEKFIKESLLDPEKYIRGQYQQPMPSFAGKLDDEEIAALAEFIKSLSE